MKDYANLRREGDEMKDYETLLIVDVDNPRSGLWDTGARDFPVRFVPGATLRVENSVDPYEVQAHYSNVVLVKKCEVPF
jgi:hypothetical protein